MHIAQILKEADQSVTERVAEVRKTQETEAQRIRDLETRLTQAHSSRVVHVVPAEQPAQTITSIHSQAIDEEALQARIDAAVAQALAAREAPRPQIMT